MSSDKKRLNSLAYLFLFTLVAASASVFITAEANQLYRDAEQWEAELAKYE